MDRLSAALQITPLRLTLAITWSLLLSVLLLQPEADPVIDLGLPRGDNTLARELAFSALHLLAFSWTMICWFWALPRPWRPRAALIIAALITVALGITTEILQTYTLDRHASWLDLAANIGGALAAAGYIWARRATR